MLKQKIAFTFLAIGLLLSSVLYGKQVPEPTDFLINDYARILQRAEVERLGDKLRQYTKETSTQIVIVTEESLEGDEAFEYSVRLAKKWGIGGEKYNNGVLIYVAMQQRAVRIQTGYGTEGFLPDVMAKRIIENIIVPAFREGKYYAGFDRATQAIIDLSKGEYVNDGTENGDELPPEVVFFIIILAIILLMYITRNNDDDDGGYYRGGRYDNPRRRGGGWVIMPGGGGWSNGGGGHSGGGGFGGFGGGGFGGFGGGGFGGGGAGGSW